jgi:hypothetical protein
LCLDIGTTPPFPPEKGIEPWLRAAAATPRTAPSARRPAAGVDASPRSLAAGLNVHRDAVYNREDTPFEFTEENYAKIAVIRKRCRKNYAASAVIPLLDLAQSQAIERRFAFRVVTAIPKTTPPEFPYVENFLPSKRLTCKAVRHGAQCGHEQKFE